jgi:DNA-3-methyladenine glycosylase
MKKLPRSFYLREDVVAVATDLLGKVLVTRFNGTITSGMITETEAYNGVIDRASHAFGGKRTGRNEMMYAAGGVAYVYLCYGIHHLFNVVTHRSGIPHAVLIRAVHPLDGTSTMRERRNAERTLTTNGPGTLTHALGIRVTHNGTDLLGDTLYIEDRGFSVPNSAIIAGPRVGVDYAGSDALLPYRFRADPKKLI